MDNLHQSFLTDHGYILLNEFIEVDHVSQIIDDTLKKNGIPKSKEDAEMWIKAKNKLQRNVAFADLVNKTKVKDELERIVGPFTSVKSCQIATRFPGENDVDDWDKTWHIDNYTEKDFKRPRIPQEFTCLVGVYLTDNKTDYAGNFTIFPGRHHSVQAFSRINKGQSYYVKNGLNKIRETLKLDNPYQITAPKGSVIIVHRMLPHLISAPNRSVFPRTIVWFRVSSNKLSPESFVNIWKDWRVSVSVEYPIEFKDEILQIELNGYGYFVANAKNHFVMRLRQFKSTPCLFSSMVRLQYYQDKISVHTNGFLSRESHIKLASNIMKECKSLIEIAKWVDLCNYQKLIEKWYPIAELISTEDITRSFEFKKLHSKSKTEMMEQWIKDLNIQGSVKKGEPGLIVIKGNSKSVELMEKRIYSFHWKDIKVI